jgi:hypothetical protein
MMTPQPHDAPQTRSSFRKRPSRSTYTHKLQPGRVIAKSVDTVFVTITSEGTIEPSTSDRATGWQRSFARHHQVRLDQVGYVTVSTVFLGVAQRLRSGDLVGAFETIVFEADGLIQESWLWSTLTEARGGHDWALEETRARL